MLFKSSPPQFNFLILLAFAIMSIFLASMEQSFVQAGEIENLYESRVLVSDSIRNNEENAQQDEALARKRLLEQVLVKVLYKVTGTKAFVKSENYQKIISQAESLVQKFYFENIPVEDVAVQNTALATNIKQPLASDVPQKSNIEPTNNTYENADKIEKRWFWASFSKQGIDQLLKKYHLTRWGSLRPDTLIWLSIEKDRRRDFISLSSEPVLVKQLHSTSEKRGIRLIFPFGDLEDKEKLSISDLWGNYSQAIKAASLRYNSQAIMAVRVHQEPSGLWVSKWSLYVLDKVESWNNRNENLTTLLSQGIHSLADRLAVLFALKSDSISQNVSIIQVNNVTNFDGFLAVTNYFKHISVIQSTRLIQMKQDSLSFKVFYLGDETHLAQSLVLGDVLQKVENTRGRSADGEGSNSTSDYVPVILDQPQLKKANAMAKVQISPISPNKSINQNTLPETTIPGDKQTIAQDNRQAANNLLEENPKVFSNTAPDLEFWLAK